MRERQIFQSALELADSQRATFLNHECGSDAALRNRVEQLLQSAKQMGDFLATPVFDLDADSSPVRPPTIDDATGLEEADAERSARAALTLLQPFLTPSDTSGSSGRLAHYEVLGVLGQGAFGIVLRGMDTKLQRIVAIKVLLPSLAITSPPRKRFLREARAAASIRHENVVSVYAVEEEPLPFLVMEFIAGKSLQERIDEAGPLDLNEIFPLARQLFAGLAAAHAVGVIHRDIKPSNILVENGIQPRVKITDFGLARTVDDAKLTQTGIISGTPMYMSPEQARGQSVDARSDLFCVGSVLYVMLTGRPPFRAPSTLAVLKRVAEESARPIEQISPEAPEWIRGIICKLHAKQPSERFQSATQAYALWEECESRWRKREHITDELKQRWTLTVNSTPTLITVHQPPVQAQPNSRFGTWIKSAFAIAAVLVLASFVIAKQVWDSANRSVDDSSLIEATATSNSTPDETQTGEFDSHNVTNAEVPQQSDAKAGVGQNINETIVTVQTLDYRIIRGATRDKVLAWTDELKQEFLPSSFNPRFGTNPMLVDAVAVPNTAKSPWQLHDVTDSGADFQQMWPSHRPAWRMQILDGPGNPPRTLFLWVSDIPFWRTFMGDRPGIHAQSNVLSVEKFFPSSLYGCRIDQQESWTLTQAPLPEEEFQTFPDLNAPELELQIQNFRERGWMPIRLMQHVGYDEPRFAVVFRDNPDRTRWEYSANLSDEGFDQLLIENRLKGLRPTIVSSTVTETRVRYRVVWSALRDLK